MNKTDTSTLAKELLTGVDQSAPRCRPVDHMIIDGGRLVHILPWQRNVTFGAILDQHSMYVKKLAHSSQSQVIFDGYGASIKDQGGTAGVRTEWNCRCCVYGYGHFMHARTPFPDPNAHKRIDHFPARTAET